MWKVDILKVWYVTELKDPELINNRPPSSQVSPYFITASDAEEWVKENGLRLNTIEGLYKNWKELCSGGTASKLYVIRSKEIEIYIKEN